MGRVRLALDPAKATGYAYKLLDEWRLGTIDPYDDGALRGLLLAAKTAGCTTVIKEDWYQGPNPRTNKRLGELHGRLTLFCEQLGFVVESVAAVTWQASFNISGQRKDRKIGAMRIASWHNACVRTQDEADAVCIWLWAEAEAKRKQLEGVA